MVKSSTSQNFFRAMNSSRVFIKRNSRIRRRIIKNLRKKKLLPSIKIHSLHPYCHHRKKVYEPQVHCHTNCMLMVSCRQIRNPLKFCFRQATKFLVMPPQDHLFIFMHLEHTKENWCMYVLMECKQEINYLTVGLSMILKTDSIIFRFMVQTDSLENSREIQRSHY